MSYADNVDRDTSENEYFVTLKPRMELPTDGRALFSGSVYSIPFAKGSVTAMFAPDVVPTVTLSLGASSSLSNNQFYYDYVSQILYFRCDVTNPDQLTDSFVITFEMYLSTKESLWYSDPTDDTAPIVKWNGCIKTAPTLSMITELQSFGFVPIDVTQMICNNDKNLFQQIMHTASFNKSDVACWHQCGPQITENISQLLVGSIDTRINYSNSQITFPITDRILNFDDTINYGSTDGSLEYFDEATFGASQIIDPDFVGKPIRMVYGKVSGYNGVNVDFDTDAPTTSNNRDWVVGHGQGVAHWDSFSCSAVAAFGTTGFTVSDANAKSFAVGDRLWIDKATDQWVTITTITKTGANTNIDTGTVISGTIAGATISKSYVRNIYLVDLDNTHWYQMEYGRDYTEANFAQTTSGITLRSTAESNAGAPTYDPVVHKLFFDVAGKKTLPTVGGVDFDNLKGVAGSYSDDVTYLNTYGAFFRPAIVLYDFLKTEFGLAESDIDTDSLLGLDQIDFSTIGFAIPQRTDSVDFPTYKSVLDQILTIVSAKGFFDSNGQFTVRWIDKIVTADVDFLKEDMLGELSVEYDYSNIAKYNVMASAENLLSATYGAKILLDDFHTHFRFFENKDYNIFGISLSDDASIVVNNISKQTSPDTIFSTLSIDRELFSSIYSDRSCKITFTAKNQSLSLNVGDSIQITRDDLPGFEPGSDNSMFFTVIGVEKGNGSVVITADDQRLVQENL